MSHFPTKKQIKLNPFKLHWNEKIILALKISESEIQEREDAQLSGQPSNSLE
jgi:hypothetical protein